MFVLGDGTVVDMRPAENDGLDQDIRESVLQNAYGQGLTYRGIDVQDELELLLDDAAEAPNDTYDHVYVGYCIDLDVFVMGYESPGGSYAALCSVEDGGAVQVVDTLAMHGHDYFGDDGLGLALYDEHGPDLLTIKMY